MLTGGPKESCLRASENEQLGTIKQSISPVRKYEVQKSGHPPAPLLPCYTIRRQICQVSLRAMIGKPCLLVGLSRCVCAPSVGPENIGRAVGTVANRLRIANLVELAQRLPRRATLCPEVTGHIQTPG